MPQEEHHKLLPRGQILATNQVKSKTTPVHELNALIVATTDLKGQTGVKTWLTLNLKHIIPILIG